MFVYYFNCFHPPGLMFIMFISKYIPGVWLLES
jgi:hypothetical protein